MNVDLSLRHDLWWALLPRSPRDVGRIMSCVLRPAPGQRRVVDALEVAPGRGVVGDRWEHDPARSPGSQVALINSHVVRALSAASGRSAWETGDNLQVDLELSERNLPEGTRLLIGDTVLEVSADTHRPCRGFHDRFGALAVKRIARANRRGLRGRGVLCAVVEGGWIEVGARVSVERRG
jgi:MOSC domain-containing protein YiiM